MKNISTKLLFLGLIFLLAGNLSIYAQAQETDEESTSAVELRGEEEPEASMPDEVVNAEDQDYEAPAFKTDQEGERAAARYVTFDNWTPWYVQCYIDGVYQGLMAPWGSLTIYLPSNRTYRLYGRADFDDGRIMHWGGVNRYISGGFSWRLNP